MNKPIFILGLTKSGTTLMRNLFDGHQDLFVVPFESHFFQNIKYWVSYYFRRTKPKKLSYTEMQNQLFEWLDVMNSLDNKIADGFIQNKINLEIVKDVLFTKNINCLRELSDIYIKAIYAGITNKDYPNKTDFVEKSVENVEFAQDWVNLYPNARFVHILRNPYSNLVAIRKYNSISRYNRKDKFTFLKNAILGMNSSYYFLYRNKRMIDNYQIIIYEDLLQNPENIMKKLTQDLTLKFAPNLLEPTLFGDNWEGNSTSGKKYRQISKDNIDNWKKDISDFEIRIVNEMFDFVLDDFGFEKLYTKKSIFFPEKRENLKTYFKNRLLYYYAPKF